jgi:hypothetical protein
MNKSIIFITDSRLDENIASLNRKYILKAKGDNELISVTQKSLSNFGYNINMGNIGRSWLNIYKQQLAGLKVATTKYVAIAEHDCLYSQEHFDWVPPRDDTFYYNENCWLVQYSGNHPQYNGMYSYLAKRKALSQLICNRELLIESIEERLYLIECGLRIVKKLGEPGAFPEDIVKGARLAINGSHGYLAPFLDKHLKKFKSELFNTKIANLDIRHSGNFTGPRRGKRRCYSIPYWGDFKEVLNNG